MPEHSWCLGTIVAHNAMSQLGHASLERFALTLQGAFVTDAVTSCRGTLEAGAAASLRVSYTPTTSGTFACEHFAVHTAGGRQVSIGLCIVGFARHGMDSQSTLRLQGVYITAQTAGPCQQGVMKTATDLKAARSSIGAVN